jgi:hypothetical protein
MVPKPNGSRRFCVDYRKLNAITVPETYPLPRMDECLDSLGEAVIFTTLECNSGYWQIPLDPIDMDKPRLRPIMGSTGSPAFRSGSGMLPVLSNVPWILYSQVSSVKPAWCTWTISSFSPRRERPTLITCTKFFPPRGSRSVSQAV